MSFSEIDKNRKFVPLWNMWMCLVLSVSAIGAAAEEMRKKVPEFEVVGLFKNMIVLMIEGEQSTLKVGGDTVAGIGLISADSESAVLAFGDERQTVYLSQRVSGAFKKPEIISVSIPLNSNRQYMTSGTVNDTAVSFLVDTGATLMAMNSNTAKKLGIDLASSQPGTAITAGGKVNTWRVSLSSVQIGGIRRENVEAAVLDGDYPVDILLGMTFLREVEMAESDGILVLSSKF
jgi:aspartyl protease family protein